jgi:hypothetical protein
MPGVRSSSCLAITRPEPAVRLRMCETPDPLLLAMLRNTIATAKVRSSCLRPHTHKLHYSTQN